METLMPFIVAILASLAAGGIGSIATTRNIPTWYAGLVRPSWTPPNWVFGPVWTSLYVLMGSAAALVWLSSAAGARTLLTALFALNLVVNTAWSLVFFGLRRKGLGFAVIIALWIIIIAMMIAFWPYSHLATYLLVPYLLWVTYASTLNLGIVILNR
jgi:tryptophan-rich sensory protein